MWPSGLKQKPTKKRANVLKTKQIHVAVWFEAKINKKQTHVLKTKQIHVAVWFEAKINKKKTNVENKANSCGRLI